MTPRVSVICPTYNRGPAIAETLQSVRAQTFGDWELLVVDDGSTDETAATVSMWAQRDSRIRLVTPVQRYGHPAIPRNIGAAHARADIVAYLDHDDVWLPDHLRRTVDALASADASAGGYEHVRPDGEVISRSSLLELVWHPEIAEMGPLFEPSRVAVRRDVLDRAGGWRPGAGLEDWDLWLRITDVGGRFATFAARTTRLLQDVATRRYRVVRPHRLVLARFDSPAGAVRCRAALEAPPVQDQLTRAAVEDVTRWYRTLDAHGDLVLPAGGPTDLDELLATVDITDLTGVLQELHLLQRGTGVELSMPLWCASEEGAARVSTRLAQVHRRQLRLIAGVVRDLGGVPLALS